MFVLEILTVFLEVGIIGLYWWLKDGRLRWFGVLGIVAAANIVSAIVGIGIFYGISSNYDNGVYYFSDIGGGLLFWVVVAIVFVAVMLKLIEPSKPKNEGAANE